MGTQYLLGATSNNELVFGKFGVTYRNGYAEFTASFNTVRPFNGENFDLKQYYEDWMEGVDKECLYDLCERFNCSPLELAKECIDVRDALDCSLYPECYTVNGDSWYFESVSCGQYDTRDEMEEITNPEAYRLLHELWDNYHLTKVDYEVIFQVENLKALLDGVNEEEWIIDYINRHMDDL